MIDLASARYKTAAEHDAINLEAKQFLRSNRFPEAAAIYERALVECPDDVGLMNNLAGVWNKCGRWDEAIDLCGKAISARPDAYRVFTALGLAHWCKHQYVQAIAAMQIPANWLDDFHMPKHNLSTLLLMHQRWEEGWWGHEYRFAAKGRPLRYPKELLWGGVTPADSLTVWGEQGVGDEILQLSCASDLLASGLCGHIVWECQSRLVEMFTRSFPEIEFRARFEVDGRGHDEAFGPREELEQPVKHLPAMSLGRLYRNSNDKFGIRDYLKPRGSRIGMWDLSKKRIGISWHSERAQYAQWKSSPLSAWAPLLNLPGVAFHSLQYGTRNELYAFKQVELNWSLNYTADLDAVAEIISTLDLVVTVSNTVAHIAAAIGIPTIVLLPNKAILPWCWGAGDTTPWYPSVKVMRMLPDEDWNELLERVTREVEERL